MKKHIIWYSVLIAAISYGNAFAATIGTGTVGGCCSGNTCAVGMQTMNCKSCLSNADCITTSGCTDCDSTNWARTGTAGYESRIEASCSVIGVCTKSTLYRCAATYYGSSTNGTTGCTRCPGSEAGGLGTGEAYGTSPAGTTSITGCYIPADIEICDKTGCFDTMANCYYKN